jgi:DNA-binding MurR/RpiR family transcriptional regulator
MNRYERIKDKIQQNFNKLPKNQKKIAEFYLDNFDRIPFLTINDISEATHSSVASIVRFAQRIGFTGFSEFRDEIAEDLQNHLKMKDAFPLFAEKKNIEDDVLTAVANQDIKNINETLSLTDKKNFNKAVKLIAEAERVFTAGLGISNLLAQIVSYQLVQIGKFAGAFDHNHSNFLEQTFLLNKSDVIVAISFPPYSKETIETVKLAKKRNIKVVSITDKQTSPLAQYSEAALVVSSKNLLYTNSFAAISVMINAIATQCALMDKPKSMRRLKEFDEATEILNDVTDY